MFKKLKQKIVEEVENSPLRSSMNSSVGNSSENLSYGHSEFNKSFPVDNDFTGETRNPTDNLENEAQVSNQEGSFFNELTSTPIPRSRRSSNSSILSDAAPAILQPSLTPTRNPGLSNSQVYGSLANLSDAEDIPLNLPNLENLSKEQIMVYFRRTEQNMLRYKAKLKEISLSSNQEKFLRHVGEIQEQLILEQKAKKHLEENFIMTLDEKDEQIKVLQTQVKLLKENSALESDENLGEANNELQSRISQLEALLVKCKENIKNNKEKIAEFTQENEVLKKRCLEYEEQKLSGKKLQDSEEGKPTRETMETMIKMLENELEHTKKDIADQQNNHSIIISGKDNELSTLLKIKNEMEIKCKETEGKCLEYSNELEDLKSEIENLFEKNELAEETFKNELGNLNQIITEEKIRSEEVQKRLESEKNSIITTSDQKIEEMRNVHSQSLKRQSEEYKVQLENGSLHYNQIIESQEKTIGNMQQEISSITQQKDSFKSKINELSNNLEKKDLDLRNIEILLQEKNKMAENLGVYKDQMKQKSEQIKQNQEINKKILLDFLNESKEIKESYTKLDSFVKIELDSFQKEIICVYDEIFTKIQKFEESSKKDILDEKDIKLIEMNKALKNVQKQNTALEKQIQCLEDSYSTLKKETNEKNEKIQNILPIMKGLSNEIVNYEIKLKAIKNDIIYSGDCFKKEKKLIKNLQHNIIKLKAAHQSFENIRAKEKSNQMKELDHFKQCFSAHVSQMKNFSEDLEKIKNSEIELKTDLEQKNALLKRTQNEVHNLEEKLTEKQGHLELKESSMKECQIKMDKLEKELSDNKKKTSELCSQLDSTSLQVQVAKNEKEEMEKEKNEKISFLLKDQSLLKKELEDLNNIMLKNSSNESQLETRLNECISECTKQKQELETNQMKLNQYEQDNNKAKKAFDTLKAQAKIKISEANEKVKEKQNEISNVTDKYMNELEEKQNEIKALRLDIDTKDNLHNLLDIANDKLSYQEKTILGREKEISDLQEKVSTLIKGENELKNLNNENIIKLKSCELEIQAKSDQLKIKGQDLETVLNDLDQSRTELSSQKDLDDELQRRLTELTGKLSSTESKLKELTDSYEAKLCEYVEALEHERERGAEKYNVVLIDKEGKLKEYLNKIEKLEYEMVQSAETLKAEKCEHEKTEQKFIGLKADLDDSNTNYEKVKSDFRNTKALLETKVAENDKLCTEIHRIKTQIDSQNKELLVLEGKLNEKEKQNAFKEKIVSLEKEILHLEQNESIMKKELDNYSEKHSALEDNFSLTKSTLVDIKEELSIKTTENSKLSTENGQLNFIKLELENENIQLKNQLQTLCLEENDVSNLKTILGENDNCEKKTDVRVLINKCEKKIKLLQKENIELETSFKKEKQNVFSKALELEAKEKELEKEKVIISSLEQEKVSHTNLIKELADERKMIRKLQETIREKDDELEVCQGKLTTFKSQMEEMNEKIKSEIVLKEEALNFLQKEKTINFSSKKRMDELLEEKLKLENDVHCLKEKAQKHDDDMIQMLEEKKNLAISETMLQLSCLQEAAQNLEQENYQLKKLLKDDSVHPTKHVAESCSNLIDEEAITTEKEQNSISLGGNCYDPVEGGKTEFIIPELNRVVQNLEKEKMKLQDELDEALRAKSTFESALEDIGRQREQQTLEVQQEIESFHQKIEGLHQEKKRLLADNELLKTISKGSGSSKVLEEAEKRIQEREREFEDQLDKLEKQNDTKISKIFKEFNQKMMEKETEFQQKLTKLQNYSAEREHQLLAEHNEEIHELQKELYNYDNNIEDIKEDYENRMREIRMDQEKIQRSSDNLKKNFEKEVEKTVAVEIGVRMSEKENALREEIMSLAEKWNIDGDIYRSDSMCQQSRDTLEQIKSQLELNREEMPSTEEEMSAVQLIELAREIEEIRERRKAHVEEPLQDSREGSNAIGRRWASESPSEADKERRIGSRKLLDEPRRTCTPDYEYAFPVLRHKLGDGLSSHQQLQYLKGTVIQQLNQLIKLRSSELEARQKLEAMAHEENVSHLSPFFREPTELEYLKKVLLEYMLGNEVLTMAKVIVSLMKFSPEETKAVIDRASRMFW